MGKNVNYKRDGFHTLTTYLVVNNVSGLIDFIKNAFKGELVSKFDRNDGSIMHAEIRIGDSMLMMGEPMEDDGEMNASIYIYVEDCDQIYSKAIELGATSVMEPTTMHHAGQRYGGIIDLVGNKWWIATHIEDVSAEEEAKRIKENR